MNSTGAGVSPPTALSSRRAFRVGAVEVSWGEVATAMQELGEWDELARRACGGVALQRAERCSPSATERREAARAFRYARRLLSAEELGEWLQYWGLEAPEWVDWLDRSLRIGAAADRGVDGDNAVTETSFHDDEHARGEWVEAVCSGALEAGATLLARWAAIWAEVHGEVPPGVHAQALRSEWQRRWDEPVPEPELEALVTRFAVSWVTLDLEWVRFSGPDPACEAVVCCRLDGDSLAEVAGRAGEAWRSALRVAEDLPPIHRSAALSAPLGVPVLAGPPEAGDTVLVVRERHPASLELLSVRERAESTARGLRESAIVDRWTHLDERPGLR